MLKKLHGLRYNIEAANSIIFKTSLLYANGKDIVCCCSCLAPMQEQRNTVDRETATAAVMWQPGQILCQKGQFAWELECRVEHQLINQS